MSQIREKKIIPPYSDEDARKKKVQLRKLAPAPEKKPTILSEDSLFDQVRQNTINALLGQAIADTRGGRTTMVRTTDKVRIKTRKS